MLDIKNFLEKFKKIYTERKDVEQIIISTIKDCATVNISLSEMNISEGKVYIKAKPIIRNQIFFKKSLIEADLQRKGLKIELK